MHGPINIRFARFVFIGKNRLINSSIERYTFVSPFYGCSHHRMFAPHPLSFSDPCFSVNLQFPEYLTATLQVQLSYIWGSTISLRGCSECRLGQPKVVLKRLPFFPHFHLFSLDILHLNSLVLVGQPKRNLSSIFTYAYASQILCSSRYFTLRANYVNSTKWTAQILKTLIALFSSAISQLAIPSQDPSTV